MVRSAFISLDGLDGAGKSTQCRLLADWLRSQGFSVVECADPGGTAIGDHLRRLLLDRRRDMSLACEALLFMASRAQLAAEVIRPALAEGSMVVTDRFLLANIVYQGHAGGLPPDRLRQVGLLASAGLEPDLTLVLDLSVEAAASRRSGEADRFESRDADYHRRVRAGFQAEVMQSPERLRLIDAARAVESVHQDICREVALLLDRMK